MAANRVRTPAAPEVVARALWLYEERLDISPVDIAREAFVNDRLVARWARAAGLPVRSPGRSQRPSDEEIRAACDAYLAEGSASGAGRALGISTTTVMTRLRLAGIDIEPRSAVIRAGIAVRYDRPAGYVSLREAARATGRSESALRADCERKRIPDALLDSSITPGRRFWSIPVAWVEDHRAAAKDSTATSADWLPGGPLLAWIDRIGKTPTELCPDDEAGQRQLRRLRSGEQRTVELAWADAFFLERDDTIGDVWPDLDTALEIGRRLRFTSETRALTAAGHQETLDRISAEMQAEDRAA
jgi:hypothetical protein